VARRFATDDIFYAIRLEPYLVATAAAHPDLEANLLGLLARTAITKLCLVHGGRQPEEHPCRAARAGVSRRRMRVVRGSGLRPRVLPQPPAPQMLWVPQAKSGS